MSEISDLNEVDASNTTLSGIPVTNATLIAQLDDLVRAALGMLKRWFRADLFRLRDSTDQTKLLAFGLSGLTTLTTRTLAVQDKNGTIALTSDLLVPKGYLSGLTLSNNATDAVNDIDVAAGEASSDGATAVLMALAASLTKRLDAAWAVGNGNGGLDTGAISNATYHIHLIKRVDTGVVDALLSLNPSAPTMPTNYTLSRRIGSIIRQAGAIVAFHQVGDNFILDVPVSAIDANNPGTAAVLRAVQAPGAITVDAIITAHLLDVTASGATGGYLSDPALPDTAPVAGVVGQLFTQTNAGGQSVSIATISVRTNTSRQIRSRLSNSDADIYLRITSVGWVDARGRT